VVALARIAGAIAARLASPSAPARISMPEPWTDNRTAVDRTVALGDVPDAIRYLEEEALEAKSSPASRSLW
jgi:hypothetical protein